MFVIYNLSLFLVTNKAIDTKLSPKAIGIPENKTSNVKTATIMAIIKGSIN